MSTSGIPPPQVIASWPKPNYLNPVTQGPAVTIITIFFGILAVFIYSARLYTRFFVTRAPGVDDLFCGIGLGLAIANGAVVLYAIRNLGLGRHVWDEQLSWNPSLGHNQYAALWLNYLALGFIKVSILLFYRRLSISFPRPFFIATWIGILYNALFCLSFAVVLALLCRPLNAYWLKYSIIWVAQQHKATCLDEATLFPIAGILSCVGDFYTPTIPLALIVILSLPKRQKIALYFLFALSYIIVVFGIVRTVTLYRIFHSDYDLSWRLWDYWLWNMLELFLGICVASAPANKPLVQRWLIEPIYNFTSSKLSGTTFRGSRSSKRISAPLDLEHGGQDQEFEINEFGRVVPKEITIDPSDIPSSTAGITALPIVSPKRTRSHTVSSKVTTNSNADDDTDSIDFAHHHPQQPWDSDEKRASRSSTNEYPSSPRSPRFASSSAPSWPLPAEIITETTSATQGFYAEPSSPKHASPLRSHPSTPLQYHFPKEVTEE